MSVSVAQAMLDAKVALEAAMASQGVTGLSDAQVALLLGQAFRESMFGRAVDGWGTDMAGSNNWGSIDSTPPWEDKHAGDEGFGKFAHVDTNNGVPYVAWFRIYPHQQAAAEGFLATVGGASPELAQALAGGPAAYAAYLQGRGYFTAGLEAYTSMVAAGQRQALQGLADAEAQGLTAADPTDTSETGGIASLEARFTINRHVLSSLIASIPDGGIVWFGDGNAPNASSALPGILWGVLVLAAFAGWQLLKGR